MCRIIHRVSKLNNATVFGVKYSGMRCRLACAGCRRSEYNAQMPESFEFEIDNLA